MTWMTKITIYDERMTGITGVTGMTGITWATRMTGTI